MMSIFLFIVMFYMSVTYACDEAICAGVTAACAVTCACDIPVCECCPECVSCLGDDFTECCDCFDMCGQEELWNSLFQKEMLKTSMLRVAVSDEN